MLFRPRPAALAACLTLALAAPALAETRPVVVELFTSQGCSSCPPADALLGELARRGDILALGYHIDYWDNLGWKDPFSSPAATERQRNYARRFDRGQVYTPQMVVEGRADMVGSDRSAVLAAIAAAPQAIAPVHFAADRRAVSIGAGKGHGAVLLVRYQRHRTTQIGAGENAHRTAEDANGVEILSVLGEWDGAARDFKIDPPQSGEGVAVLVQAPPTERCSAPGRSRHPASPRLHRIEVLSPHLIAPGAGHDRYPPAECGDLRGSVVAIQMPAKTASQSEHEVGVIGSPTSWAASSPAAIGLTVIVIVDPGRRRRAAMPVSTG